MLDDSASTKPCDVNLIIDGAVYAPLNPVSYGATPVVTSISPSSGSVEGGTEITLIGTMLGDSATTVTIYGAECVTSEVQATKIVCTTSAEPFEPSDIPLIVDVEDKGYAALGGLYFKYIDTNNPQISAISPSSGSILGGTVITITGLELSSAAAVKVGDHDCEIDADTQTATNIDCRIIKIEAEQVQEDVNVLILDSNDIQIQQCIMAEANCYYRYLYPVATVTAQTSDIAAGFTQVTFTGTGFGTTAADLSLTIEGVVAPVVSVSDSEAVFQLTTAKDTSSSDFEFYLPDGIPAGLDATLNFAPGLLSISVRYGSSAGFVTQVTGVGFGVDTADVNLYSAGPTKNICSDVTVTGYGQFTCTVPADTAVALTDANSVAIGASDVYACANDDADACTLQSDSTDSLKIEAVIILTTTEIEFEVSSPNAVDEFEGYCEWTGLAAPVTSSRIIREGVYGVTCTFLPSIPAQNTLTLIQLTRYPTGDEPLDTVTAIQNGVKFVNAYSVIKSYQEHDCSYAGGCKFVTFANGLTYLIEKDDTLNYITICDQRCEVDFSLSTADETVCFMAPYATKYSAQEYDIAPIGPLDSMWTGTGSDLSVLNDGDTMVDLDDDSSLCSAEITAMAGYIFGLREVSIYFRDPVDRRLYNGNLQILGSDDDGVSYTVLYTFDLTVKVGWNKIDVSSSGSSYNWLNKLKIEGAGVGSCTFSEVEVIGVEVVDNNEMVVECEADIIINGEGEYKKQVKATYSNAATPYLAATDALSQYYGSDEGQDQVTFSGEFLDGQETVTIYGLEQTVNSKTSSQIGVSMLAKPDGEDEPNLQIYIAGYGYAATRGLQFTQIGGFERLRTTSGKAGNIFELKTVIYFDEYYPISGSNLGGSLMTINGGHFGIKPTDNPVKIGDNFCVIISTSDAEIKCRVLLEEGETQANEEVPAIVFAKTSEEMVCRIDIVELGDGCVFNYHDPLADVTDISADLNFSEDVINLTITGTGFVPDDLEYTELYIDGEAQQIVSVTETEAVFELTYALDTSSSDIIFYTVDGLPSGDLSSVDFTPTITEISLSSGSEGGFTTIVTGVGFGVDTADVNLYSTDLGQNVCSEVEVIGYGEFICEAPADISITLADTLQLAIGSQKYDCSASTYDCSTFETVTGSPELVSATIQDTTTIVLVESESTGAMYDADCVFQNATAIVTYNNGDVICTFSPSIPVAETSELAAIDLIYYPNAANRIDNIVAKRNSVLVSNPKTIDSSGTEHDCSFAGGCTYSVTGDGISGSLSASPEDNYIEICSQRCELDYDLTDADTAVCRMAALATSYSAPQYEIAEIGNLEVTWTGNGDNNEVLNDNVNTKDLVNQNSDCYAEITAKQGFIFGIEEVKIFLNSINSVNDKAVFTNGGLILQGSDGTTVTDLHSYDDTIHEGWNTVDWRDDDFPLYKILRLQGSVAGACRIGEVRVIGFEVFDTTDTTVDCPAKLIIGDTTDDLDQATYADSATPQIDMISPRFGSVLGGEQVTFTGTNLAQPLPRLRRALLFGDPPIVTIDNRDCAVDSSSATEIVCTTSDKPYVPGAPSISIYIEGYGLAATGGKVFRYISRWSDSQTWGYDLLPQEGEAVNIPSGLQLLVDVPITPVLSFVLVEGSLIFESDNDLTSERFFDARYILVANGGYMEVGTEDDPYLSKLTITMHGVERDPFLPTYGNKVIGVRYGQLEMHGAPRSVTWTDLMMTAEAGDTSITLNDQDNPVDWAVGEYIVIASTDFDGRHAEQRMITALGVSAANSVLTLDSPLEWKHYAGEQTFGSETVEMRAEVGLLTRNVVYRGDPETTAVNQYGAHIMLHSPGDESVIGRIENCEFFDVGQAFKLGRYPIHFHMIGTVTKSYIKKNSIHQTYNRGTTLHGVHYLEISDNVMYKTMGHTIFIEDAIETKNLILRNLVVDTRASNSLLNTDSTPACFWITNPDNIFRGNHAAGSDRYGYWFDTQVTSTGPSFDPNICPENTKLGEFSDNVAHSVGRYGLRIFHNLIPRTYPCEPLNPVAFDPENPDADRYPNNPIIPAIFTNFLGYKAGRNGAIAERVGAVEFHDFVTVDNILAGIEFSLTEDMLDGYAKVVNGVVIGKSENTESKVDSASPHGIIGPRTEGFTIEGTKFFNYNFNSAAALGDCSHCFHPAATDSGSRTYTVENLEFTDVTRKIRYQYPERGIFYDKSGSLTDQGPGTYASKGYRHNQQPECTLDEVLYDGVVCDDTVAIRRVVFYNYQPSNLNGIEMNIIQWDNDILNPFNNTEKQNYIDDDDNYSRMFWKPKLKPNNSWAVPWVTGHIYRITWGNDLDYTRMFIQQSEKWVPEDLNTLFNIPFIDAREAINVTDVATGDQIEPQSISSQLKPTWYTGYNYFRNETGLQEILVNVNGFNPDVTTIELDALQCISGVCPQDVVEVVPISDDELFWSDPLAWPSGIVPVEGEDVEIEPQMNIVLDIITPRLNLVTVNGRLSFYDYEEPIELKAKQIYVRAGEFLIGTEERPYEQNGVITLYGERDAATEVMSGSIETGNKLLLNTGLMKFVGVKRSRESRLLNSVYRGETEMFVEQDLDWRKGDKLYFAPTNLQWTHSEYRMVEEYDFRTGILVIDEGFDYFHFGASSSTSRQYSGVDIRGEVRLLTRNIRIVGAPTTDLWGGQVLTRDRVEFDGTSRIAVTQFDYVEVEGCSQENTFHAAIRFESTGLSKQSYVNYTVVHESQAWSLSVRSSRHISIKNSDFIGSKAIGVNIISTIDVHVENAFVADVKRRDLVGADQSLDKEACVAFCSYFEPDLCYDTTVTDSIAAGCVFAGFVAPGHDCDETGSDRFRDNVAHSNERVGAHIYPDPVISKHSKCYEGSYFAAYKNQELGLSTMYSTEDMRMRNMVFIDNQSGMCLQTAGEREEIAISLKDTKIYGEDNSDNSNTDCPEGNSCYCPEKFGLMLFGSNQGGKPLHPTSASQLPIHKIKSYGAWGGEARLENVEFINFKSEFTECGKRQSAIARNPYAADYIPRHKFVDTTFNDVNENAMIYIKDPPQKWANPTDCVEFPCTAPENVVLYFSRTKYSGSQAPIRPFTDFVIVSDVEKAVKSYGTCSLKPQWSAAQCTNRNLGVLLFESLDADTEDRTVSPIILKGENGYENVLNSMMDHTWDGFYTGQKRLSRFPAQIETDEDYEMKFTGTPPGSMRYVLKADRGAVKIKIYYPNAGAYAVYVNGVEKEYTPWDKDLGRHGRLTKTKGCGENRFVGIENFLEFYLTTDCVIVVKPNDSIQVSVRLDWTLDEFYANDGYTAFVDRVSAVLNVNPSQVKTVAIYQGSVFVDYLVEPLPEDKTPEETLKVISKKFFKDIEDGNVDLGAPIISAAANLRKTVDLTFDGYEPLEGNLWDYILEERAQYEQETGDTFNGNDSNTSEVLDEEEEEDTEQFEYDVNNPKPKPVVDDDDDEQNGGSGTGEGTDGTGTDDGSSTGTDDGTGTGTDDGSGTDGGDTEVEVITTDDYGFNNNVVIIEVSENISDTSKYLIGLLIALVIALLFFAAYGYMNVTHRRQSRMPPRIDTKRVEQQYELQPCNSKAIFASKLRTEKGVRYIEQKNRERPVSAKVIYVATRDDDKDIFTGRPQKVNQEDNVADVTFTGRDQEVILFGLDPDEPLPTQGNQLITEADVPETGRMLRPESRHKRKTRM